ncbi:hypothetical protein MRX96_017340 [Rhipicephalus microplus]
MTSKEIKNDPGFIGSTQTAREHLFWPVQEGTTHPICIAWQAVATAASMYEGSFPKTAWARRYAWMVASTLQHTEISWTPCCYHTL